MTSHIAKAYITKHCTTCKHFIPRGTGLCSHRRWNSISGMGAASMRKMHGVAALPVYPQWTCENWSPAEYSENIEENWHEYGERASNVDMD